MAKPSSPGPLSPGAVSTRGAPTLTDAAVATLVTGTAFATDWLSIAGTQAAAMSQAFAAIFRGDDSVEDGVRSALDQYGDGLRQMALLPRTYGLRFFQELEKARSTHAPAAAARRSPRMSRPRRRSRKR
jgi:hypothetical protein